MRKVFFANLLSLMIIGGFISCEKQHVAEDSILSIPSCFIASQTTKELVQQGQPTVAAEKVTAGSETFTVSLSKKSIFSYDAQGRILTEYSQYPGGNSDSIYYQYSPASVAVRKVEITVARRSEQLQTIALNDRGYALVRQDKYNATYDSNGYLMSLANEYGSAKVVDGNITEILFLDSPSTASYTTKNVYDLSKQSLPSIRTFYGKDSRNLLISSSIDKDNRFSIVPNIYSSTFTHTFDENGRVIRQVMYGKDGVIPYLYGGTAVRVNDFTYKCTAKN